MAERVLLAGCGDVGLRLAQQLLARGDEVFGLRRQPPADTPLNWVQADLARPESLQQLPADITQLVYLPTPDAREEAAYRAVFLEGLKHLLHALRDAPLKRVLLVSSSAVYGEHAGAWVDENTPTAPLAFNGRVLCEAETWLMAQHPDSVVLRLAGLYGPQRWQWLERLRSGQARVPRDPPHWANRIHVDDAAGAIAHLLALPLPQPLYLGVDDTPQPLSQLYDGLCEALQLPLPAAGPPPPNVGSKRLSNARLKASGFACHWPDSQAGYLASLP